MRLHTRSLIVRWAFLAKVLLGDPLPRQTSVCALFWRSFLLTPFYLVAAIGVLPFMLGGAILAGAGYGIYLLAGAVGLGAYVGTAGNAVSEAISEAGYVVGGYFMALKRRACPIVRLEE